MHIYNYVVKSPVFSYLFFMHFSPFSFSLLLFVATVEWLGEGAREDTDRQTDRQEQKSDYWIFLQESYPSMAAASAFAVRGRISQNPFSPLLNILENGSQNLFAGLAEERTTRKKIYIYIYLKICGR